MTFIKSDGWVVMPNWTLHVVGTGNSWIIGGLKYGISTKLHLWTDVP